MKSRARKKGAPPERRRARGRDSVRLLQRKAEGDGPDMAVCGVAEAATIAERDRARSDVRLEPGGGDQRAAERIAEVALQHLGGIADNADTDGVAAVAEAVAIAALDPEIHPVASAFGPQRDLAAGG